MRKVIKTVTGIMLILMLCIGSGNIFSTPVNAEEPSPVPTPTPTVSVDEVISVSGNDAGPAEDEEPSLTPSSPTPAVTEEDDDCGEAEIIAAATATPTPYPIQEAVITLAFETAVYTGDYITQEVVSVEWNHKILTKGSDYIVTGSLVRKDIGTYEVKVIGTGTFGGTASVSWSIVAPTPTPEPTNTPTPTPGPFPTYPDVTPTPTQGPVPPTPVPEKGFKVTGVRAAVYTGKSITQDDAVVWYNGKSLAPERDYKVSYKRNVNAGTATMVINGKGSYKGKYEVEFTIEPVKLQEECSAEDMALSTKATLSDRTPVVYWGDKPLKRIRDYEMSVHPNQLRDPGEYEVTITGTGNFAGSIKISVIVREGIDVRNIKVGRIQNQEWTGFAVTPVTSITYKNEDVTRGIDVTYERNINAGTAYMVITGNGEPFKEGVVFSGTARRSFRIKGKNLEGARVRTEKAVYTGKPVKPALTVKIGSTELIEDRDYTISYSNNIKMGTAEYRIRGCGGYSGVKDGTFEIHPCPFNEDHIEVELPERVYYEKGGNKPSPIVTHENRRLRLGVDYIVEYDEDRSADDTYKVMITGCGSYSAHTISREVMVYSKPIDMCISMTKDPIWSSKKVRFKNYKVKPVLVDTNGVRLEAGVDYDSDFYYTDLNGDPIDEDDYVTMGRRFLIHINGIGNYNGTKVIEYRAAAKNIEKVKFKVAKQQYTGYPVEPDKDQIQTDIETGQYEIILYKKNIKTGCAVMVIHGLGEYGGYKKVKFTISKYNIKG